MFLKTITSEWVRASVSPSLFLSSSRVPFPTLTSTSTKNIKKWLAYNHIDLPPVLPTNALQPTTTQASQPYYLYYQTMCVLFFLLFNFAMVLHVSRVLMRPRDAMVMAGRFVLFADDTTGNEF